MPVVDVPRCETGFTIRQVIIPYVQYQRELLKDFRPQGWPKRGPPVVEEAARVDYEHYFSGPMPDYYAFEAGLNKYVRFREGLSHGDVLGMDDQYVNLLVPSRRKYSLHYSIKK